MQQVPSVELAQKLRLARQLANLVVVSIHWGNELQDWPTDAQQQQARWLVEHGADLIVGHHPHVVQAPACVEGKPVFFSLGNHLFDQKYAETKDGLIADCSVHAGRLLCGALSTHTDETTAYPRLAGRNAAADQALAGCSPQLGPGTEIDGVTIRPEPWSPDQPVNGIILDGYKNDGEGQENWRGNRGVRSWSRCNWSRPWRPNRCCSRLERHTSSIDDEVGLRPYVYAIGPTWPDRAMARLRARLAADRCSGIEGRRLVRAASRRFVPAARSCHEDNPDCRLPMERIRIYRHRNSTGMRADPSSARAMNSVQ